MVEVADNSNGGSVIMPQGDYCTSLPNIFPVSVLDPLEPLRRLKDTSIIINQIMSFPSRQIHHDFSSFLQEYRQSSPMAPEAFQNRALASSAAPQAGLLGARQLQSLLGGCPHGSLACLLGNYQGHERARRELGL